MVIDCGRLVVVSSILPGDFFLFFVQNCCFWVHSAVRLGILVEPKKRSMGTHSLVAIGPPNAKSRAPCAGNRPFYVCTKGTRGRFLGAYGQIRAAGRDVNQR